MKIQSVFLTWTSLKMDMDSDFKKKSRGRCGGILCPPTGVGVFSPPPPPPYASDPMLIIYPLNLKEHMITLGSAAYEGGDGLVVK